MANNEIKIYGDINNVGKIITKNYEFPREDGSNGQVLQTDGGGTVTWASVSGGTGSTSPGGSPTEIQYNDSGSFAGDSNFTWCNTDSNMSIISTQGNESTVYNFGCGCNPLNGSKFRGGSIVYNNALSGASATTAILIGNLSGNVSDNTILMGYGNLTDNTNNAFLVNSEFTSMVSNVGSQQAQISVTRCGQGTINTRSTGGTSSFILVDPIRGISNSFPSGGTFSVYSDGFTKFGVNDQGYAQINDNYCLPNTDGNNGQVMITDGFGNLSWTNMSGGTSGGTSPYSGNPGNNSTVRLDVNNTASNSYAASLGGRNNTASGYVTFIGGGCGNQATFGYSSVSAGRSNTSSGCLSHVGGGINNTSSSYCSVIAGGSGNAATGCSSTIAGGSGNRAGGNFSSIGGGWCNRTESNYATIAGGWCNCAGMEWASVLGGYSGQATGQYSTVAGGAQNTASGNYSATLGGGGGGFGNQALGVRSAAVGGFVNIASGCSSTVIGGCGNTVSGCYSAIIAGENFSLSANSTVMVPNLKINGACIEFDNVTTPTSAQGGAYTLPSNPSGFMQVEITGTTHLIPFYSPV